MQNVGVDWMDGWIPLRLLRLLEHLRHRGLPPPTRRSIQNYRGSNTNDRDQLVAHQITEK